MADKLTINGLSEEAFLTKYYHNFVSVEKIGLDWPSLVEIHDHYRLQVMLVLDSIAKSEFDWLRDIPGAYITKYRVKDPEHLIDKVIRKKKDDGEIITKDSYVERFDDLVGFRILHLFKNNWEPIHKAITEHYELNETPIVYHRKGDSEEYLKHCAELGLTPKEKKSGYRSLHYIIKKPTLGINITCEIQVRTMIEDAWSEIDHIVRYPNNTSDELINSYLLLFNNYAGSADEMGTFLMSLKQRMIGKDLESQEKISGLTRMIEELKCEISTLKIENKGQRDKINDLMSQIDSGVGLWYKQTTPICGPTIPDILSQIQNPSGLTGTSIVEGMQTSIESYLKSTEGVKSVFSGLGKIEMPKPFSPAVSLEQLSKYLGEDEKTEN